MATTPTASLPSFTVTVKGTPVTFTSAFASLAEAYHALASTSSGDDFAAKLLADARARKLTPSQAAWIHKLATDARPVNLGNLLGLLLRARSAGKRFPKLHLEIAGEKVVLALTGERSKEPNTVAITDGRPFGENTFYGRIAADGTLIARAALNSNPTLKQLLVAIDTDPAKAAGQHGVAIGRCCFCARELTTKESRSVGYGPDCAEKHGLPWGETAPADEADAAARAATTVAAPAAPVVPADPFLGLGTCTCGKQQARDSKWCLDCGRSNTDPYRAKWRASNPWRRDVGERNS